MWESTRLQEGSHSPIPKGSYSISQASAPKDVNGKTGCNKAFFRRPSLWPLYLIRHWTWECVLYPLLKGFKSRLGRCLSETSYKQMILPWINPFLSYFYYFCYFQHRETLWSSLVCDQAREAVIDQEGAMHGSLFAAHYEKEGDKIFQDHWFFSLVLPPIADPVGSV